jgi:Co/Zn/Cd efflux system component
MAERLGDAGNYAMLLIVLGMATIWCSPAAYVKGGVMGAFGELVLARALWIGLGSHVPEAETTGIISIIAFAANWVVALLLHAFRNCDPHMRSVWLCTRNDMIANLAVLMAAIGVIGTKPGWPDIAVASIMAFLGPSAAREVMGRARSEFAKITSPLRQLAALQLTRSFSSLVFEKEIVD